jgi:hypothetical protein
MEQTHNKGCQYPVDQHMHIIAHFRTWEYHKSTTHKTSTSMLTISNIYQKLLNYPMLYVQTYQRICQA